MAKLTPIEALTNETKYVQKSVFLSEDIFKRLEKCCNDNAVYKTKAVINTLLDMALKEIGY